MGRSIFRRGEDPGGDGAEVPASPLRERARSAAEALSCDNSCRWFSVYDVFPVYNYLYDYYRGRREDRRLRGIAGEGLVRLNGVARRLEATATVPLPPEWGPAKVALAEASDVFDTITRSW